MVGPSYSFLLRANGVTMMRMNEGAYNQSEKPKELWRTALDKIVAIKHAAETRTGAAFKELQPKDWEDEAIAFLERNKPLCDALYRRFWWNYADQERANGRKVRSIRMAEKSDDYPSDPLYLLLNSVVLKREHGNNRHFIDQILDDYETERPEQ